MTQAFNLAQFANNLNASGQAAAGTSLTGAVAVANGGTGATTLTANNVILGNGTGAVQAVAPSTTGNVLTSNGATWTSAAPVPIAPTTAQVLTATAGATAGAVGTYAFLRHTTSADYAFGATLAGSSLNPAGVGANNWQTYTGGGGSSAGITYGSTQATAQSGTWRCMGVGSNIADSNCPPGTTTAASVWLRIS